MNKDVKSATAKQVAYIQVLKRDLGEPKPELKEDLSVEKASKVIEVLLDKMKPHANGNKIRKVVKINEPRLGMAMKECFKIWKKCGRDIYETKREVFKEEVIRTYKLFTEISEVLGQEM